MDDMFPFSCKSFGPANLCAHANRGGFRIQFDSECLRRVLYMSPYEFWVENSYERFSVGFIIVIWNGRADPSALYSFDDPQCAGPH